MEDLELAYANMKAAQQELSRTRAEVEPRIVAIRAEREQLRRSKEFCLTMAMLCFAAPALIVALVGIYRFFSNF